MSEYKLPLDKLLPSLIKFQSECPAIVKDKENSFITEKNKGKKAMYADLATINETIKKPLSNNNLAITQPINDGVLQTYLYHISGQFIKSEIKLSTEQKTPQAIGSEITYMRRYSVCAILGIAADDDDDGNAATTPTTNKNTPHSPTTPPKPQNTATGEPDAKSDTPVMANEAQRKQFWKKAEAAGWSKQDLADCIIATYGVESSAKMTMKQGKEFLEYLDTLDKVDLAGQMGTDVPQV